MSIIKKALCIKPSKTLLNYLKLLEQKFSVTVNDLTCSTIEEKEETEGTKSEIDNKLKKNRSNFSKFTILKFAKIFLYSCFHLIRKNKILFLFLISISGYYFKLEIQNMFEQVLNIVKFK